MLPVLALVLYRETWLKGKGVKEVQVSSVEYHQF